MRPLVVLPLAVALLALAGVAWRAEPRRWRVGVLLLGALWAATSVVNPLLVPAAGALLLGILFAGNGLRLVRPEGSSLADAAALALGVAMVAATAVGLGWVGPLGKPVEAAAPGEVVARIVLLLPCYPGLAFVGYALYCLAHGRHRPRPAPAAVVVLGSGLVDGTVPRLLAHRLEAASAVWRDERALGHAPLLVPSGGQGDDEPMAEGVAMSAWLVAHGTPPEAVAVEDRATTTEENLLLSREIVRARGLGEGHLRVVTSGYHVGRAALLARRLGIDADVTGAPTAWYFVPSAFLREFVGALTLHPRTNLAGLGAWAALTAYLAYAVPPL